MVKQGNKLLFLILALCVLILVSGCGKSTETLLNEGQQLDSRERYQEAIAIYDQILAKDSNNIDALLARAIDKGLITNDEGAIDDLQQILRMDSTNALALYNLGITLGNLNRYTESIIAFNAAAESTSGHFVIMEYVLNEMDQDKTRSYDVPITAITFERGIVYYKADSLRKAYFDFTFCIKNEYNTGESFYYRGRTYLDSDMLPQGCDDLRMALMYGERNADELINKYCK